MLEMNMPQCIYVSDCLSTTAAITMMFLNNRDFQRYALLECTTCQYFDIIFQEQVTKFMCNLCSNGSNTCKSLYRALTFKGVKDINMRNIWDIPCPKKIKHFFLWLAMRNRIQSAEQLKKKGWDGSLFCQLCREVELTKHIIFSYPLAHSVWCVWRDALLWGQVPYSSDDVFLVMDMRLISKCRAVKLSLLASTVWTLWLTRNHMVFRDNIAYSHLILLFQIISHLMQWKPMLPPEEKHKMEALVAHLRGQ